MAARRHPRPTPPYTSEHAEDRWRERAERVDDYDDLWTAWADAEPISLPAPYHFIDSDEARYHADAKVVLCRRGDSIQTVYDVLGSDADRVVRLAIEKQLGISLETPQ